MLRMISQYNHFPTKTAAPNDMTVPRMYVDGKIWQAKEEAAEPTDLLMLIEPRPLQEENYNWAMLNYDRFEYIFTHDSQLLSLAPNALPIYYWRDYELKDVPKTKGISMICGTKDMCPVHHERMKVAKWLMDLNDVDVLGDLAGAHCTIDEAYSEYRFAIVIENHLDDRWFTEKLLNAFSHKTIPIYYGARKPHGVFMEEGIIRAHHLWDIPKRVKDLINFGIEDAYNLMKNEVDHNFEAVKIYRDFEDYFFTKYSTLIERVKEEMWRA